MDLKKSEGGSKGDKKATDDIDPPEDELDAGNGDDKGKSHD